MNTFEYVPIMFDDVINSKHGEINDLMALEDSKYQNGVNKHEWVTSTFKYIFDMF